MRKGFIFTLDSLLAALMVVVVAASLLNYYTVEEARDENIKTLKREAKDAGIKGFYFNRGAEGVEEDYWNAVLDYGHCERVYSYAAGQMVLSHLKEKKFCRGKQ